jgi:nicotinamidase-related amidase
VNRRLEIRPERTALIVVDMQNDFCHPNGYFARARKNMLAIGLEPKLVQAGVGRIRELLDACRGAGLFIIHSRLVREADQFNSVDAIHRVIPITYKVYSEVSGAPPLAPRSWGADIHQELGPLPGEYVVVKRAFSAFYQTDLEMILRRRGIDAVILAGTVSYVCVLHTAFDAHVRDFDVIVASDGTVAWAPDLQAPTMRIVDLILGVAVPCAEIAAALPATMSSTAK